MQGNPSDLDRSSVSRRRLYVSQPSRIELGQDSFGQVGFPPTSVARDEQGAVKPFEDFLEYILLSGLLDHFPPPLLRHEVFCAGKPPMPARFQTTLLGGLELIDLAVIRVQRRL